MENWITTVMEEFGYIGVFLLIMLENLFPPIPSEVILTFGGFWTTQSDLSVFGVVVASTIGSVVGAIILYGIGALVGIKRIERFVDRWGKVLRLTSKDIHKANSWFEKYDVWTVFFCRFIPLMRSLISLAAVLAKMNFFTFLLLTTLGTLIWNLVLVNIGAAVGESWETIVHYMDIYSNIAYAVLAIIFIVVVVRFYQKKMRS